MLNEHDDQRRAEVHQSAEAFGSAGLQTAPGHREPATGRETLQVNMLNYTPIKIFVIWSVV